MGEYDHTGSAVLSSQSIRIGACSLCGGDVTIPQVYMSTRPPVPTCNSCGAVKRPAGPVIDMVQPKVAR